MERWMCTIYQDLVAFKMKIMICNDVVYNIYEGEQTYRELFGEDDTVYYIYLLSVVNRK